MKTSISFLKYKTTRMETVQEICKTDTDYIHVDMMDGKFVENKVLPIEETLELLTGITKPIDIHLMVEDPEEYIRRLNVLHPKYISIHVEIEKDIGTLLNLIREYHISPGLAINPETNIERLKPYLSDIDYIIVMGVKPGAGGQKLIPETVEKLKELSDIREQFGYHYETCIDGGVNLETRGILGYADVLVSGSYVCLSDNLQEKIDTLR